MRRLLGSILMMLCMVAHAQDTIPEVVVEGTLARDGMVVTTQDKSKSVDQMLSTEIPSITMSNDNGMPIGYTYFKMRGMAQERVNITLDGIPFSESEDFGAYFVNHPQVMQSIKEVKVVEGPDAMSVGGSAYAGAIMLKSIDPLTENRGGYAETFVAPYSTVGATLMYNSGLLCNRLAIHSRVTYQYTDGVREHSSHDARAYTFKIKDISGLEAMMMLGQHWNGQGWMGVETLPKHLSLWKQQENGCLPVETDNWNSWIGKIGYTQEDFSIMTYWTNITGNYRVGEDQALGVSHDMVGLQMTIEEYLSDHVKTVTSLDGHTFTRRHVGYMNHNEYPVRTFKSHGLSPIYENTGNKPETSLQEQVDIYLGRWTLRPSAQLRMVRLKYTPKVLGDDLDKDFTLDWVMLSGGLTVKAPTKTDFKIQFQQREPSRTDLLGMEYRCGELLCPTKPEKVISLEAKQQIRLQQLTGSVNGYVMVMDGEMIATGEVSMQNALPLHKPMDGIRAGVEAMLDYKLSNIFSLDFIGSFQHSHINGFTQAPLTRQHQYQLRGRLTPCRNVYAEGLIRYESKANVTLDGALQLPERWQSQISLMWKMPKVELGMDVTNVLNRVNVSQGYVGDDGRLRYQIDAPMMIIGKCRVNI